MKTKTQEQFMEDANKIHNNYYDYSFVEYKNSRTNIIIICPKHGEFLQRPNNHLRERGCEKCGGTKKKTTQDIIAEFTDIHGDKYNYDRINYINNRSKVVIICQDHGEFKQRPNDHLQGTGCPKCAGQNKTTKDLVSEFRNIHKNKYNYDKVIYKNVKTKVIIICSKHGEFLQRPSDHLKRSGCPDCGTDSTAKKRTSDTQQFIEKAKKVHGEIYDYSLVEYKKDNIPVKIICSKHGVFKQIPNNHLQEKGCPKCVNKNETKTGEILTELLPNISVERQLSWGKIFNLKLNRRCDFYFEKDSQKYIVEYNGRQHYQPVQFGKMSLSIAKENFKKQQQRDQELKDLCAQHNINLIEIDGREYQGSKIKDYLKKRIIRNSVTSTLKH